MNTKFKILVIKTNDVGCKNTSICCEKSNMSYENKDSLSCSDKRLVPVVEKTDREAYIVADEYKHTCEIEVKERCKR